MRRKSCSKYRRSTNVPSPSTTKMARLLQSKTSHNLMDPFQFQKKYQQVGEQQQNEEEEQRGINDNGLSRTKKVTKNVSVIMPPADQTSSDFEQISSELTNVNDTKEDIWAQKEMGRYVLFNHHSHCEDARRCTNIFPLTWYEFFRLLHDEYLCTYTVDAGACECLHSLEKI
ncbi:hypothetical protein NCAS_0C05990 [Naumovozyma castellii]|uniref:Uncharacterized protein n=1 Tax=Naumovozyma castellii TaxID=27288 RepID=G0VDM7_NAUCA|nr:hypothetical protein NCAS_0C05990 [Naumovozyma castellii CBS 4309]CCC69589.1 hypothetical protein NCAS_0C05990 [Naumovozyma castellii CBS 4309]